MNWIELEQVVRIAVLREREECARIARGFDRAFGYKRGASPIEIANAITNRTTPTLGSSGFYYSGTPPEIKIK